MQNHSPKNVAIIQARMSSTRLPQKVLLEIGSKPMLQRVVERTRRATLVHEVIVATTIGREDEAIVQLCKALGVPAIRGSVYDVLDRYYRAAQAFQADVIVRITADCPLIDPTLIDQVIDALYHWGKPEPLSARSAGSNEFIPPTPAEIWQESKPLWDFAANRLPPPWKRTFPIGLDVEVCTFEALERAWKEATQPYHREHVMPYLYEEERSVHLSTLQSPPYLPSIPKGFFRVLQVDHHPDYGSYRWTVDTVEDYELVRQIYAHFGNADIFSWVDVLELMQKRPELTQINASVLHKTVHDTDQRIG